MKKLLVLSILFLSVTASAQMVNIRTTEEQKAFNEWVQSLRNSKPTSSEEASLARVKQYAEERKYGNDLLSASRIAYSKMEPAAVLKEVNTTLPRLMTLVEKRVADMKALSAKLDGMTKAMMVSDMNSYIIAHKDLRDYSAKLKTCGANTGDDFCVKFLQPAALAQLKIMTLTVQRDDDNKFQAAKNALDKLLK